MGFEEKAQDDDRHQLIYKTDGGDDEVRRLRAAKDRLDFLRKERGDEEVERRRDAEDDGEDRDAPQLADETFARQFLLERALRFIHRAAALQAIKKFHAWVSVH